jgi:hypothetical protein
MRRHITIIRARQALSGRFQAPAYAGEPYPPP